MFWILPDLRVAGSTDWVTPKSLCAKLRHKPGASLAASVCIQASVRRSPLPKVVEGLRKSIDRPVWGPLKGSPYWKPMCWRSRFVCSNTSKRTRPAGTSQTMTAARVPQIVETLCEIYLRTSLCLSVYIGMHIHLHIWIDNYSIILYIYMYMYMNMYANNEHYVYMCIYIYELCMPILNIMCICVYTYMNMHAVGR